MHPRNTAGHQSAPVNPPTVEVHHPDATLNSSTLQESARILLRSGGSSQDLLGPVLSFFQSMATLRVTEAEYTLLAATVLLCSGGAANQSSDRI